MKEKSAEGVKVRRAADSSGETKILVALEEKIKTKKERQTISRRTTYEKIREIKIKTPKTIRGTPPSVKIAKLVSKTKLLIFTKMLLKAGELNAPLVLRFVIHYKELQRYKRETHAKTGVAIEKIFGARGVLGNLQEECDEKHEQHGDPEESPHHIKNLKFWKFKRKIEKSQLDRIRGKVQARKKLHPHGSSFLFSSNLDYEAFITLIKNLGCATSEEFERITETILLACRKAWESRSPKGQRYVELDIALY